jgi:hypothetical protein
MRTSWIQYGGSPLASVFCCFVWRSSTKSGGMTSMNDFPRTEEAVRASRDTPTQG